MKYLKKVVYPLLLIAIAGLFIWYVQANWQEFASLRIANPLALLGSALLVLASLYSAGMVNELTMEPHGVHPKRLEVFGLATITRFLNQVAPNYVGASARAVYFKRNYGVSYAKFSSSFAVANILQLIIASFIAVVSYVLFVNGFEKLQDLVVVFVSIVVLLLILMTPTQFFSRVLKRLNKRYSAKIFERLSTLPDEFEKVRSYPKLFSRMVIWMTLLIVISGLLIYSLFFALGHDVTLGVSMFISAMANLSIVLSVTPAGLGVREGMIVFGGSLAGIPVVVSLAISILFRAVMAGVTGPLSLLFSRKLLNRK